jgi:small subunit ribosomal protein S8
MRTDLISDTLTMIRNASRVRKENTDVPKSKLNLAILEILKREGYISNLKVLDSQKLKLIRVYLSYDNQGKPAISGLKRISKPGLRRYVGKDKIPHVLNGLGIAIISTSRGIVSDKEARQLNTGGEVLLYAW